MDNVIDKLLLEWSWRCEKGYPDINNPADKKVLDKLLVEYGVSNNDFKKNTNTDATLVKENIPNIVNLLQTNKYSDKILARIERMLNDYPDVGSLKTKLAGKQIDKETFDNRDLSDDIISILQRGGQSDIANFMADLQSNRSKGIRNIPSAGNIFKYYPTTPVDKIRKIGNISGAFNVVSMGKGELLFPITFDDVEILGSKAGDLKIGNETVELKATGVSRTGQPTDGGARLGEGRAGIPYVPINFPLAKGKRVDSSTVQAILRDYTLATQKQPSNVQEVVDNVAKYLSKVYFKDKQAITVTPQNLSSENDILALMYTALIEGYVTVKQIDKFLLFDPISGNFKLYTPANLITDLISGKVKTTSFSRSSSNPQLISF